ncbi:sulfatase family protein [Tessaracoccus oleiagri]|uniref:Arylsulfatase A n=1 Tax=Tessaracoccus oleiagri TaxID=686624 RepID=A0A1G9N1K1_9ACTN|nr:sulfatase [Tessaracoccus oleiagri]SDL80273.1 Arylsulfatase A [Tessaracoccus oleiagri]
MNRNLLFVLSDQFRAMALEDDPVATPVLDRFAEESIVLSQAVSSYPVCSPHRAMLLTGVHPSRNGVFMNLNTANVEHGVRLRDDVPSWARALADSGYDTAWIGKWHLQEPLLPDDEIHGEGRREDGKVWDAWSPPHRRFGFKEWYSHGCCDSHLHPHYWPTEAPRERPDRVHRWSAEHETDVAINFLSRPRANPFALAVSWNPPHQPFDELPPDANRAYAALSPEELLVRPNVAWGTPAADEAAAIAPDYFAAVEAIDAQFGRLLETLDRQGLAEDTIVVFTSDHGMQLGSHGLVYKNVPFEESMRLPCVIRVPGVGGRRTSAMLSSVDIAPTLLGLLGVDVPSGMQGRDLSSVLLGLAEVDRDESALYYCWSPGRDGADMRGVRTHGWKYVVGREPDGRMWQYAIDLQEDPYELHRIEDPRVIAPLASRLVTELAAAGDEWEGMDWVWDQANRG